jgi:hypothetical protein
VKLNRSRPRAHRPDTVAVQIARELSPLLIDLPLNHAYDVELWA